MPLQVTNVQQREHVFVPALPGLEPAVEAEASALGLSPRPVEGGVELTGAPGLHQEANLRLRTASRVWLRLGRFAATDANALAKGLAGLPLGPVWDGRTAPRLSVVLHRARFKGPDAVLAAAARAWGLPSVERAGVLDEESSEGLTLLVPGGGRHVHGERGHQRRAAAPARVPAGGEPGAPARDARRGHPGAGRV